MNVNNKKEKLSAKLIKKVITQSLRVDANNTSCIIIYQPNVPATLKKFSKIEKE